MEQKIRTAIAQLNSIPDRPEWAMLDAGEIRIESKDSSVCIAIDDIGVKKQKDKRQKPEAEKQGNKDDPEWSVKSRAGRPTGFAASGSGSSAKPESW